MPLETPVRIVQALADRGYNAEREAVTLVAEAADPAAVLERVVETVADDALRITAADVRAARATVEATPPGEADAAAERAAAADATGAPAPESNPSTDEASAPAADAPPSTAAPGSGTSDATRTNGADRDAPVDAHADGTAPADGEPGDRNSPDGEPGDRNPPDRDPSVSGGDRGPAEADGSGVRADESPGSAANGKRDVPVETKGSSERTVDESLRSIQVAGDVTGHSTGTGEYGDFVRTFRDRYDRLSRQLRGRVNRRPAGSVQEMPGGSEAAIVGLVNDVRSTKSGHWLVELEDPTGVFPCLVMKDRAFADAVDELLFDECVAVEGTLADDGGILFVDAIHFPDVPRTYRPSTADRHVQAALISDVHVGSQEFVADAWHRFTEWLHTEAADAVEYLLIAGDMVEGVGVYPDQDEELDVVDIYDQYEAFSEYLKEVPGDMEIVMIPGNHDAVRLAEPQPGFDEELRDIMTAHDARIHGNPSTVTVEGVSVLMYHGVSLDEVIAELPAAKASYDEPHKAMYQLLKKRHVAPQYGGHLRLAPEERDYLVIDDVPDVFHTGHVHKLGWGKYHNVLAVNSGCWQAQTAFQKSVNIDPDVAHAPILDLDTLEMTVRKFV